MTTKTSSPSRASASSSVEPVRLRVPMYKHHLNHDFDFNDDAYIDAYSRPEVHEASIMDKAMIEAFQEAIFTLDGLIKDKIVLDIGCGVGVLSFMCVAAGAMRVYAVDANEHIATKVKEIVEEHNLSKQIIVIHGKIEDVEEIEPVDVIISNWMGCLLFDEIISVDLYHLQGATIDINKEFSFQPLSDFVFHAFAFWFKVYFNKPEGPTEGDDMIILSTGPADPPTHWAQTLLYAYSPLLIKKNMKLEGCLQMSQSIKSPRFLDIRVTYNIGDDFLQRHATFRC